MKRFVSILVLSFVGAVSLSAQNSSHSLINELNTVKPGQGNVMVLQEEQLSTIADPQTLDASDSMPQMLYDDGYRIQIFSGNNPYKSRDDAYSRRSQIVHEYPGMDVQIIYKAPFWRVRAGNFTNKDDAMQVLTEMKSKFPIFGKEMYVVKDKIKRNFN